MFAVEEDNRLMRVQMSASLDRIDEADTALGEFLERLDPPVDRFAVRILAREALLNAVTHGSRQDPQMVVRMSVVLREDHLEMVIEDEGQGFDWRSHNGCFEITGDGGRGLPLMRIYSSGLEYNACGNRVQLWCSYEGAASCGCRSMEAERKMTNE